MQGIPNQYKPISAWGYLGLTLLYSIPIVGFIFLIIYACSQANINRRNYARSYFISILLVVILFLIALALGLSLETFNIVVNQR